MTTKNAATLERLNELIGEATGFPLTDAEMDLARHRVEKEGGEPIQVVDRLLSDRCGALARTTIAYPDLLGLLPPAERRRQAQADLDAKYPPEDTPPEPEKAGRLP